MKCLIFWVEVQTKQDRRRIESDFFGGNLCGVAATNALELGIDVGHIDATLHLGFPGSIARWSSLIFSVVFSFLTCPYFGSFGFKSLYTSIGVYSFQACGSKQAGQEGEKKPLFLCMWHLKGLLINISWNTLKNFLGAQLSAAILMLKTNRFQIC